MIPNDPEPRLVYLLLHEAAPIRESAERDAVNAALRGIALPAFNHGTYKAGESGAEAIATARTLPMMAAKRLVVVRDLHEGTDAFYEALLGYLARPSDTTVLVLAGSGFPKVEKGGRNWSSGVTKAVAGLGGFALDRKSAIDPVRFAVDAAAARGKRLDVRTARQLVELTGAGLGPLVQEVEKLSLYAGDSAEITPRHVEEASALVADAVIWDLTTALAQRDRGPTLVALQRLLDDGLDPRYLLSMITWKLRSFAVAAEAVRAGADDASVAKVAGVRFDDVRAVRRAVGAGLEDAHRMLARLAGAHQQMNGHRAGAQRILERLVVDWLC